LRVAGPVTKIAIKVSLFARRAARRLEVLQLDRIPHHVEGSRVDSIDIDLSMKIDMR
jgi:hypothetical protein